MLPIVAIAGQSQIGRYVSVDNKPTAAQVDLMQQTLQIHFPTSVVTVGDAVSYLLANSGYSLVDPNIQSPDLTQLLNKNLPIVDRDLYYMNLKQALLTLVEPAFYLEVDPLHRLVNFDVKPKYKKYYQTKKEV